MNQQINLYQPRFRKQRKVFSALAMVQVLALIIVALAGLYIYNLWSLQPFEEELANVRADKQRLQDELAQVEAANADNRKSQLLEDEIRRVQEELAEKQRVAEVLESGQLSNHEGFGTMLEALARQHLNGLWLTRVVLERGGKWLSLTGKTINSELVPQYIERLASEAVFSDLAFNVLEIKRDDDEPGVVSFQLATRLPDKKG